MSNYAQEDKVLRAAMQAGEPILVQFKTANEALQFRFRCNKYRKDLRKLDAPQAEIMGRVPTSPFDQIKITFHEPTETRGRNKVGPVLKFEPHGTEIVGITTMNGEELALPEETTAPLTPNDLFEYSAEDFNLDPGDILAEGPGKDGLFGD